MPRGRDNFWSHGGGLLQYDEAVVPLCAPATLLCSGWDLNFQLVVGGGRVSYRQRFRHSGYIRCKAKPRPPCSGTTKGKTAATHSTHGFFIVYCLNKDDLVCVCVNPGKGFTSWHLGCSDLGSRQYRCIRNGDGWVVSRS